jgi:hypothetical protein
MYVGCDLKCFFFALGYAAIFEKEKIIAKRT